MNRIDCTKVLYKLGSFTIGHPHPEREREMGLCEYPQEAEESNVQMAQKFVSLCTSILQV